MACWGLFFFSFFFLQFVQMEILVTALTDMFPKTLRPRKNYVTAAFCVILCLLGFTCVTRVSQSFLNRFYIPCTKKGMEVINTFFSVRHQYGSFSHSSPFYKTARSRCCPDLSIGSKVNSGKNLRCTWRICVWLYLIDSGFQYNILYYIFWFLIILKKYTECNTQFVSYHAVPNLTQTLPQH